MSDQQTRRNRETARTGRPAPTAANSRLPFDHAPCQNRKTEKDQYQCLMIPRESGESASPAPGSVKALRSEDFSVKEERQPLYQDWRSLLDACAGLL